MNLIGIDPGLTGAVAVVLNGKLIGVTDLPVWNHEVDARALGKIVDNAEPEMVVIEKTQAMPKNGSIASYSLGYTSGQITGIVRVLRHPCVKIRPIDWKRKVGLVGKDKNASRELASSLWPEHYEQFRRVKDNNRAEAALIAYAYEKMSNGA